MPEPTPDFICDACKVLYPNEHRCHGIPCRCPECAIECSGCHREAPEWLTEYEGWFWTSPHPSDGLPDVLCPQCQDKELQWEASVGLDKPPADPPQQDQERCGGSGTVYKPDFKDGKGAWLPCPGCPDCEPSEQVGEAVPGDPQNWAYNLPEWLAVYANRFEGDPGNPSEDERHGIVVALRAAANLLSGLPQFQREQVGEERPGLAKALLDDDGPVLLELREAVCCELEAHPQRLTYPDRGGAVSLSSIRDRYGVPAKRGKAVTFEGRPATITSGRSHYLYLRFEGEHTPQGPFHPLWEMDYLDGVDYGERYDRRIEAFNAAFAEPDSKDQGTEGDR